MIVPRQFCRRRFLPINRLPGGSGRGRLSKGIIISPEGTVGGFRLPFLSSSHSLPPGVKGTTCFIFGGGGVGGMASFSTSTMASGGGGGEPAQSDLVNRGVVGVVPPVEGVEIGGRGMKEEALSSMKPDKETEIGMLEMKNWKWLAERSPGFAVKGSNVHVITCPSAFYRTVMEKISLAKKRISLASLYLGNGSLEQSMVDVLKDSVVRNPNLKVKVLLDYTRGSRGEDNSRTMMVPLLEQSKACHLYLYHTPTLRGLVKKWLPPRWNEVIGLQHMKIYLFDDSILISGANLSNDYFTNRQDRYMLIENSAELANFFDELVTKVSGFSFNVNAKNELSLQPGWNIHPSDGDQDEFIKAANTSITSFYEEWRKTNHLRLSGFLQQWDDIASSANLKDDTWIFPLIQMGALNISLDHEATCEVFKRAPSSSTVKLATGYFNLTSEYINTIIGSSTASYEILMAHPKANGFLGARGFAGGIPAAYTLLAKKFFQNIQTQKQEKRISMWEYIRPKWTFHAKGLWYYPVGAKLPMMTLVGSPNFGHRSVHRDLETQMYLVTLNKELRLRLDEEQANVFENAKPFSSLEIVKPERQVPLWVKMVILFFRNFF